MLKSGKLANAIKEMRQARLYVLGLTEVRWEDGGDFVSDGVRVIYAGEDESQRGVAVLLDKTATKCVTSVEHHSDRLLVVNASVCTDLHTRMTLLTWSGRTTVTDKAVVTLV